MEELYKKLTDAYTRQLLTEKPFVKLKYKFDITTIITIFSLIIQEHIIQHVVCLLHLNHNFSSFPLLEKYSL